MPTRVCRGAFVLSARTAPDQLQPRPNRPLGIILVGLRIAEIHQHAVAHVFGHEAAETAHGLGDAFLIGRNDLAQVLRVHAGGERRRADQVREHHRDLATFGGVLGLRLRCRGRFGCCRGSAGKLTDGREQFSPMPERDAEILQILIGQMWEYRDINLVLGKALGVLGQAERGQPLRDRGHHLPPLCLCATQA